MRRLEEFSHLPREELNGLFSHRRWRNGKCPRAGLRSFGHVPCKCRSSYETKFSSGARAEQNPEDWWSGFVTAARKAIADSSVDPSAIEAITLATTSCTVVALDAAGKPLRPSIIWMDVRASAEADAVLATADIALQANGGGEDRFRRNG